MMCYMRATLGHDEGWWCEHHQQTDRLESPGGFEVVFLFFFLMRRHAHGTLESFIYDFGKGRMSSIMQHPGPSKDG
jgi:hypothetical protein